MYLTLQNMYLEAIVGLEGSFSWLDYPGFEAWRFFNLFLFVAGALYLHQRFGKPIGEALRLRRQKIKSELEHARNERDQARRRLAEVETRLKDIELEVSRIREQALSEAEAERRRILASTELEMEKLREQGRREIQSATKTAQAELRRFVAGQSVQFAEVLIQKNLSAMDDARLIQRNIDDIGGREN